MARTVLPDFNLYAGRWIAVVRGRIVASGSTAHETLLHCRAERIKDEPILRYVPPLHKTKNKIE